MTIFDVHQKLSLSGVSFVCLFDWESEEERRKHRVAGSSFCLLARSLAYGVFFLYCYYYDEDDDDNDDRRWMR